MKLLILAWMLASALAAQQPGGSSISSSAPSPAAQSQEPTLKPGETRPAQPTEREIQRLHREIQHEVLMLPDYSVFDMIGYELQGRNVTLSGAVRTGGLKTRAADALKNIEGIDNIQNNIEVLPASGGDDRIRQAVARAIFRHSPLFEYGIQSVPPIRIIVKRAHVTLEGVVRRKGDKNAAGIQARRVNGVFQVTNNLRVEK